MRSSSSRRISLSGNIEKRISIYDTKMRQRGCAWTIHLSLLVVWQRKWQNWSHYERWYHILECFHCEWPWHLDSHCWVSTCHPNPYLQSCHAHALPPQPNDQNLQPNASCISRYLLHINKTQPKSEFRLQNKTRQKPTKNQRKIRAKKP